MSMQYVDPEVLANESIEKLRFVNLKDFWAFVGQVAASRMHAYIQASVMESRCS